jgi:hypothetical protein
MGCGQAKKTSAPQASTKTEEQKTLLTASEAPSDIHFLKDHQRSSVTSVEEIVQEHQRASQENDQGPEDNHAHVSVTAAEEIVQEQKDDTSLQRSTGLVASAPPTTAEAASNLESVGKGATSQSPPIRSTTEETSNLGSVGKGATSQSPPIRSTPEETSNLGSVGKGTPSQSPPKVPLGHSGGNAAVEPSAPAVKDSKPPASAGLPRREKICGCC